MKIKYIMLLITMCFAAPVFSEELAPLCTKEQCGTENACTCYCSVICGPRKIKPGDTPKYDEEAGQCFCAPRDKRLWKVNGCDVKEARARQANQAY